MIFSSAYILVYRNTIEDIVQHKRYHTKGKSSFDH